MKREPLEGRDSLAFLVHYRVLDKRQAPPTYPWSEWVVVIVAQSCLTLCDPVDYAVPGIRQARILEWVAFPFSKGSSQTRDLMQVCRIASGFFTS